MFQPCFADAVAEGTKCQTIRPVPKRMPGAGDKISLRCWTGAPYRSKQRTLREAEITKVLPIEIRADGIKLCGLDLYTPLDRFAQADGFRNWEVMRRWFACYHGLPFHGILICWEAL